MAKYLQFVTDDGEVWEMLAVYIANRRGAYFAPIRAKEEGIDERSAKWAEVEYGFSHDSELIDWAANNEDVQDLLGYLDQVKGPDREPLLERLKRATIRIVEHETADRE